MFKGKSLFILFTAAVFLCGCNNINSSASVSSTGDNIEYPDVWTALHNFNWMAENPADSQMYEDKPFLSENAQGMTGAATVFDINRDGAAEFLMSVVHPPRGIPAVEVFTLENGQMESMGGFFWSV